MKLKHILNIVRPREKICRSALGRYRWFVLTAQAYLPGLFHHHLRIWLFSDESGGYTLVRAFLNGHSGSCQKSCGHVATIS